MLEKAKVELKDLMDPLIEYTQQDFKDMGLPIGAAKRILKALMVARNPQQVGLIESSLLPG